MCGKGIAMIKAAAASVSPFPQSSNVSKMNGHVNGKLSSGLEELIPDNVGKGTHRKSVQNRTLVQWTCLAAAGIAIFHQNKVALSAGARAAALGLVFPGAGFLACGNFLGAGLGLLTAILIPVTLFVWFGAGGLLFPILIWVLGSVGAYYSAGDLLFEQSTWVAGALLVSLFVYFNRLSSKARIFASVKRDARNSFLPKALAEIDSVAVAATNDAERELDLEDLRDMQYVIDMGLKSIDDWEGLDTIDQFQTSARRYKLYEHMYCLGAYQGIYTPNFHGYSKQAFEQVIEKSLTPKVLGFWKWETLWGKFSTNYDPVIKDNIMVTGFLLQGVMLYTANTGDMRYAQPRGLKFRVTENDVYEYDLQTMSAALVRQWTEDAFCLFPCEPNWIYTPCNLQGMTGQIIYDRVFKTNHAKKLLPIFEKSLTENFTEPDGSILPIRSQLTGFTIPGLCGALSDLVNALLCRGHMDHIAKRMWAIFRHECVRFDDDTGELQLVGLVGADKMDAGNYTSNEFGVVPMLKYVAGEYGDEQVRKAADQLIRNKIGKITTSTGATRMAMTCSDATNSCNVRGSMLRHEDWKNLISKGPSPTTLAGPILGYAPYPGVLVAKARSYTSKDLDLVLHPSNEPGDFVLGVERLQKGAEYVVDCSAGQQTVKADATGQATFTVRVEGRTRVYVTPA